MTGPALPADVRASLEAISATYEVVECKPDLADTAAFCEHYGFPLVNAVNAILVASRKEPRRHAVCLVRADTRLDVNRRVRKLMEVRKVSFADAEETRKLTGMMIGGVTPFGLPDTLPVYIDAAVFQLDYAIVGGGDRSAKLKIQPEVLKKLPKVEVVEGLAVPSPAS